MARKDERGVVIPAPLQGSDAALAGKRYGDKHRGPAVVDAYELTQCWIDLAERSERWPSPPNLPPLMVKMACNIPEDQRADWLRRQANLEEVDRRISYAIRTGDLPIWVAPQGEPEQLVATGALATIDKRSVNSGVFCPLSEEYKSEADRPWLWERPLFVKKDDWVHFATAVDAERRATIVPDPFAPLLPPDGQSVTLSHALSWVAFGVSMDSDQLHEVLSSDRYGEHDPQEAIKVAVAQLVKLGRAGCIAMEGKYLESHRDDKRTLLTTPIEPIKFADFRQFNYLHDELKHGNGLWAWREPSGVIQSGNRRGGRSDFYCHVSVSREDLLRAFPQRIQNIVDRSKQHDFATEALPQREIEQASGVQGEWLLCFQAVRQFHRVLKEAVGDADPAPWVTTAEWHENLQTLKWNARTSLTFRRALLAGDLKAYFLTDGAEQLVPGWAWENDGAAAEAMHMIALPIDPFLDFPMPSDMRTFIRRAELDSWLQRDGITSAKGLPVLPQPYDIGSKPVAIRYSKPSDKPFVHLTEAVTWAAFNIAMSRDVFMLGEHYRFGPFASENYAATINDAVIKLIDHASGGSIRVRGRSVKRYFDDRATKRADTTDLPDNALRDFGRFDPVHGGLQAGQGYFHKSALEEVFNGSREDGWRDVEVCYADLLRVFPVRDETVHASVLPLPASLPDIGLVMGLDEAMSWLAFNRASNDALVWQDAAGKLTVTDSDGNRFSSFNPNQIPADLSAFLAASRTIHGALRDGSLPAYVAPTNGGPLLVPRFYWNGVNPESLHYVYRGMTPGDHGAGCPVLLSRQAFEAWRATLSTINQPETRGQTGNGRKRPGPAPDPDWPHAIAKVTQDCIAAGYTRPLKRGGKAAIQTMLLSYMADKDKHFSDDIAAKHAKTVIAALPDN